MDCCGTFLGLFCISYVLMSFASRNYKLSSSLSIHEGIFSMYDIMLFIQLDYAEKQKYLRLFCILFFFALFFLVVLSLFFLYKRCCCSFGLHVSLGLFEVEFSVGLAMLLVYLCLLWTMIDVYIILQILNSFCLLDGGLLSGYSLWFGLASYSWLCSLSLNDINLGWLQKDQRVVSEETSELFFSSSDM